MNKESRDFFIFSLFYSIYLFVYFIYLMKLSLFILKKIFFYTSSNFFSDHQVSVTQCQLLGNHGKF